jgi:hypothetical protein
MACRQCASPQCILQGAGFPRTSKTSISDSTVLRSDSALRQVTSRRRNCRRSRLMKWCRQSLIFYITSLPWLWHFFNSLTIPSHRRSGLKTPPDASAEEDPAPGSMYHTGPEFRPSPRTGSKPDCVAAPDRSCTGSKADALPSPDIS